jgi:hypothetical protein
MLFSWALKTRADQGHNRRQDNLQRQIRGIENLGKSILVIGVSEKDTIRALRNNTVTANGMK